VKGKSHTRVGFVRRGLLRGYHVAGFNLSLLMRVKTGHATPRGWASAWLALIWPDQHPSMAYLAIVMVVKGRCCGIIPIAIICRGE